MFEAVWAGDIKAVNKLTVEKPIGKQAHVCSRAGYTNRTPLHVAMQRDNQKMLIRLIEIALEQFTPLTYKEKKKDDKVPLINNYELTRIMSSLKVRYLVLECTN